jgi:ATP-dependent Clp protease protease subunit
MKVEQDTAEVMVYSSISSDKFWGDEYTPDDFDKALKDAKKDGATKLNLRINSPGGDVFSAVAMRSMIINAEFDDVRVMIEGLCASAATLFATIPGAKVVIADGSEFMIHNPMTVAWGNAAEIEKTAEHLRSMEGTFHEMYAGKCGKSEEQIKEWMDAETWFTAKRAVEEGFCDELLESEKMVACVSVRDMAMMCEMYHNIPKDIAIAKDSQGAFHNASATGACAPLTPSVMPEKQAEEPINGSNDDPVAGLSTSNNYKEGTQTMEIKDCTREQLLAENPALVDEIVNQAVTAERERVAQIESLTLPGFEAEAEEARKSGASVTDFIRTMTAKAEEKKAAAKAAGNAFIAARQEETKPAEDVAPGAAEDDDKTEEEEIRNTAKEIAGYAAEMSGSGIGMF